MSGDARRGLIDTKGFEAMPMPADPGLTLTTYSAEPGSPASDALRLLASWAATIERSVDAGRP